jgi:GTP pyrophosphokinase
MTLTPRFDAALLLARRLHDRQLRKGGAVPYVSHLLGVASLVLENGGDEDQAIAALLHDAVEDQGGADTLHHIRHQFGSAVAGIVEECSDCQFEPKPPWRARKEAYLVGIQAKTPAARLVCCADKLHNARSLLVDYRQHGETLWQRFNGGRDGTLWYYRSLVDAFRTIGPPALAEELERTVAELERLAAPRDRADAAATGASAAGTGWLSEQTGKAPPRLA